MDYVQVQRYTGRRFGTQVGQLQIQGIVLGKHGEHQRLICLLFLGLLLQWFTWIFSKGRFGSDQAKSPGQHLRFVFSEAAIKLINDFRHLLALVIVLIFGCALAYAMFQARASLTDMKEALQSVVATLGGLVGSIIGYYFGESTLTKTQDSGVGSDAVGSGLPLPAVQGPPTETIREAPPPPEE